MTSLAQSEVHLPRVAIEFCTQCKWNLRAAYYAQELLQTFSTGIGEISLIPVTGGIFTVTIYHLEQPQQQPQSQSGSQSQSQSSSAGEVPTSSSAQPESGKSTSSTTNGAPKPISNSLEAETGQTKVLSTLLWDRKAEGGFPETKELKNRVRNVIQPDKDLGHIDRSLKKGIGGGGSGAPQQDKTVGAEKVSEGQGMQGPGKDDGQQQKPDDKSNVLETTGVASEKVIEEAKENCEDCR